MIVDNHHIAHRNVASKYYNFFPEEIDKAFSDFQNILENNHYNPDGRIFFSILSDPTSEIMDAKIFLPIVENQFTMRERVKEEFDFHSYFFIKPMIMTRVTENFDELSQVKYWELIDYIKRNDLTQKTPVFVEFKSTYYGKNYVEMSVGVLKK